MPDTADAWYIRSFATLNTSGARPWVAGAVERDASHRLAWERLMGLSLCQGDGDGALAAALALLEIEPNNAHWILFAGQALTIAGRYDEALSYFDQAKALMPNRPQSYRYRAGVHLCRKEYAEAEASYTEALATMGFAEPWDYYQRATVRWIEGRLPEAAADCRAFIRLKGHSFYTDARLFLILRDQGRRLRRAGDAVGAEQLAKEAETALASARRGAVPGSWLESIFQCLSGDLAPEALVRAADRDDAKQMCEAYYYTGEACVLLGHGQTCGDWFRRCVATGVRFDRENLVLVPMNEYHLACWRLDSLSEVATDAADSGDR
jgi:tetratricopeptide (TPR) repeat protein